MTAHVLPSEIERLALNSLSTTDWARIRHHLFECDYCLRRVLDGDAPSPRTESTGEQREQPPVESRSAAVRAYVY